MKAIWDVISDGKIKSSHRSRKDAEIHAQQWGSCEVKERIHEDACYCGSLPGTRCDFCTGVRPLISASLGSLDWFATSPQDALRNDGAMLSIHQVPSNNPERGRTIAEVYGDDEPECIEHGNLIAAAPALLEAAKLMIADWNLGTVDASSIEFLKDAIRKAEGKCL